MEILIDRPNITNKKEISELFKTVIVDSFIQDGIGVRSKDIKEEVNKQIEFLNNDFNNEGRSSYFLIARLKNKIVATIAVNKANRLIQHNLKINVSKILEVSSVYILPKFQGKGIGTMLFNKIIEHLKQKNCEEIVLDGGYKKSQGFWIKN